MSDFLQSKVDMKRCIATVLFLFFIIAEAHSQQNGKRYSMYPTIPRLELRILDTITNLREVRMKRAIILNSSKGSKMLKEVIWKKPAGHFVYYWIKVVEDNGRTLQTHFNFYVDPVSMEIKFYDPEKDVKMTLREWRRVNNRNP